MKLVKFTYLDFESPCWVNPSKINWFVENDNPNSVGTLCTCIFFSGSSEEGIQVVETPEEVAHILESV